MGDRAWYLSEHAKERAAEMGLSHAEIVHVIEHAEVDYAQPKYGDDQRIAKCGDISAAYNAKKGVIITVLYNTQVQYARPGQEASTRTANRSPLPRSPGDRTADRVS